MKVFSVTGLTGSGKTTTIEKLIGELKNRGFSVGTVKEIHNDQFKLDIEGKNTYRHRKAGSEIVTARASQETDIMYRGHKNIYEVLSHYDTDYVILEGARDIVAPEIACCSENGTPIISPLTFALSGRIANNINEYQGLPVISAVNDLANLTDLILERVPDLIIPVEKECCQLCGYDCYNFLAEYLRGNEKLDKCVLKNKTVTLTVNGSEITMVPFVQKILKNAVIGVVKELNGFVDSAEITVKIR